MSNINIKIEGWDKIAKGFAKSPQVFIKVFDVAIKKSITVLLGTTRARTPIDTGFLKGKGMETTFEALTGRITNSAPYSTYVHEGTSKMQARPFFMWGVEDGEAQVQSIFSKSFDEFISKL